MKVLIITNGYPSEENLYKNTFIHRRNVLYKEQEIECRVFVLNSKCSIKKEYIYENIRVTEGNSEELLKLYNESKPQKLIIHFINKHMIKFINEIKYEIPVVIFVHGFEALGWYRRLYDFKFEIGFIKYILGNMNQMWHLRKFIKTSKDKNVKFVFVSKWMKKITEKDTLSKINNSCIIHNVIDENIFKYELKNEEQRKKILTIRPFESKKYANDLTIEAILRLSKKEMFKDLDIHIYGKGRYFNKLTEKVKEFENVHIFNKYLKQEEIYELHKKFGIFLCPTRQDSQGVSMCEAMSSGLVPITSDNTAIPEFVDNSNGILTKNSKEIARAVEELYYNPQYFLSLSKNSAESIFNKCNSKEIINKEIKLIKDI